MIEKGYIYWIIIPLVFIAVGICFYLGLHKSSNQEIFNSFKIITTGIAVITLTIAFVNIIRNKRLADITDKAAKNAEKLANEAKSETIKSYNKIRTAQADFRIELLRNSLEHKEYRRSNDQLKEVKDVIIVLTEDDDKRVVSQANTIVSRIERMTTTLSSSVSNQTPLSDYDFSDALDLVSKIDTLIKKNLNKLI